MQGGTTVARWLGGAAVVPFAAHRVARPKIVLRTPGMLDMSDDELVERFAWAVPAPRDPEGTYAPRTRTLFAERYGGEGVGFYGGGVRVGSDGELQIKGLGQNPLAGRGACSTTPTAGCRSSRGSRRRFWSEVFDRALPFGAVRCPAVLLTGSPCWWVIDRWGDALRGRYGDDVYLPRGLLVREAAIRPAHFERAMLDRPPAHVAATLPSDVERVRSAIPRCPTCCRCRTAPRGCRRRSGCGPARSRWRAGSPSRAPRRRASASSTATSARRTSASMAAGIDFGSVTALPGWGNVGGYGPFWDDSEHFARIFSTLCFNIRKYYPARGEPVPQQEELLDQYVRAHARSLELRFLALTGLPFELLDGEEGAAEKTQLYRTLVLIAQSGHRDPFEGHPDDESAFGTYRLGSVLLAAARWWHAVAGGARGRRARQRGAARPAAGGLRPGAAHRATSCRPARRDAGGAAASDRHQRREVREDHPPAVPPAHGRAHRADGAGSSRPR